MTVNFFDNNHFSFGWGNGLYNFADFSEKYWVSFSPCSRKHDSFAEEVSNTCKSIASRTHKKIYVFFSGGIDSEIICTELLKNKIDFTPIIIRHKYGNIYDTFYAFKWCDANKIKYEVIECDILSIMENEKESNSPHTMVYRRFQQFMIEEVQKRNGYAIIGSGEQRYEYDTSGCNPHLIFHSCNYTICDYLMTKGIEAAAYFYLDNPELVASFANDAILHLHFEEQKTNYKKDVLSHNLKTRVVHHYWPDLTPRKKFHGFEKIEKERVEWQNYRSVKFGPKYSQSVKITHDELLTQLGV